MLARLGIKRIHMAAVGTRVGTGVANEHLARADPRRTGDVVALRDIARFGVPAPNACLLVDGHEPAVRGGDDGQIVVQCHTSISPHPNRFHKRSGAGGL